MIFTKCLGIPSIIYWSCAVFYFLYSNTIYQSICDDGDGDPCMYCCTLPKGKDRQYEPSGQGGRMGGVEIKDSEMQCSWGGRNQFTLPSDKFKFYDALTHKWMDKMSALPGLLSD